MSDKTQAQAKTASATSSTTVPALPARPFAAAPASDRAAPASDRAALLGHHFAAVAAQPRAPLIVQPKLTLGPVGDRYEQEADRVAAQVVGGLHAPAAQRPKQPLVQRVATAPSAGIAVPSSVEAGIAAARGGGQPLPARVRGQMETAMGADFSGVRVHTDSHADALNRAVQARAFTTGRDVFFRRGEYQPGSGAGRGLLAHELTHIIQQNSRTRYQTDQQAETQVHLAIASQNQNHEKQDEPERLGNNFSAAQVNSLSEEHLPSIQRNGSGKDKSTSLGLKIFKEIKKNQEDLLWKSKKEGNNLYLWSREWYDEGSDEQHFRQNEHLHLIAANDDVKIVFTYLPESTTTFLKLDKQKVKEQIQQDKQKEHSGGLSDEKQYSISEEIPVEVRNQKGVKVPNRLVMLAKELQSWFPMWR